MEHQWVAYTLQKVVVAQRPNGEFVVDEDLDDDEPLTVVGCQSCDLPLQEAFGAPCLGSMVEAGVLPEIDTDGAAD